MKKMMKHKYPHYVFDKNAANKVNYAAYQYWLICDEGHPKPEPMRQTYFLFKYGQVNSITKRSILSYIPKEYKEIIEKWVSFTKHERKEMRKLVPDVDKKVKCWMHQAKLMYYTDINSKYD